MSIFSRVLRAGEGKALKELQDLVDRVNDLETEIEALSDADLKAKTAEFRKRLADGQSLDDVAPEAFAVVRSASQRVLHQRPYDSQVIGAGALHRGMIAEMRTGEGKTLASTMPTYLNGLSHGGVHIVTVNDYLAKRDAEWMGNIHRFLGLEVGLIQANLTPAERRPQYQADVTYGTNNEFGFDYLRDNMAMRPEDMVQKGHAFAIVDEVDSILVDEARTPLIISGRVGETGKWYRDFARITSRLLVDVHYEVDEKKRQVFTTEAGVSRVEEILGVENMYDHANVDLIHHLDVALKALALYEKDVDYMLAGGEVKIVDEFTGRVLEGRRYSEGLHQAIEAKEGVKIKEENQTLATITLQNYFRMYEKLAGMTGTAKTEAGEFAEIYGLQVVEVPTNKPVIRVDQPDSVYVNEEAKFNAVAEDLVRRHELGQPVLVGTVSIEKSERLSNLLRKRGVAHEVLNAKHHEREATIVAQAGRLKAVTVATNMAGRGVDIQLGGNPEALASAEVAKKGVSETDPEYQEAFEKALVDVMPRVEREKQQVLDLGGLYVLATERHDSRRIDNQLRGRSGRQGDPGESRFYLSLEDDLMRRFQSDRVQSIMERLRIPDDVPIEHKMVSKSIERSQTQVEAINFEARKNVLKYDEVMNTQREIIYKWRNQVLLGEDDETSGLVSGWRQEVVESEVLLMAEANPDPHEWDWEEFDLRMKTLYDTELSRDSFDRPDLLDPDEVIERYQDEAAAVYEAREAEIGEETVRQLERTVVLSIIDNKWREHLAEMDYLRAGIGLRAMGQRDPLVEYQREGFDLFSALVDSVKHDSLRYMYHVNVVKEPQAPQRAKMIQTSTDGTTNRQVKTGDKVGRNAPCPCGSGKKYKKCHGAPGAQPIEAAEA
ncbi:MAG: preprotein translocase subunit SecA [Acidimicrobiia bacterium]|nr:preprotein translocase subunit SecA [Acidimicrobiia bacterium]